MSFYVTLISDSSLSFFPDNKTSQFTTQLPSPINLNGEWEMAIVDVINPHIWYTVRRDTNLFSFDFEDGEIVGTRVPPSCYEIPDLIKCMALASHKNRIEFSNHPVTKGVIIKMDKKNQK